MEASLIAFDKLRYRMLPYTFLPSWTLPCREPLSGFRVRVAEIELAASDG